MPTSGTTGEPARTVAAVDLGSNSFHMVVGRWAAGRLQIVDKLRERVQLAAGLDAQKRLQGPAVQRAIGCLERFGQRLRDMPAASVRVVGTNTLRRARNAGKFLQRAEAALGHPIDVISGREEARLIYEGVSHDVVAGGRRLVADIGGGSTECIVGRGPEVVDTDSLYMGCVSFSQRFFADGRVTRKRMERATLAARLEIKPIERRYQQLGWTAAVGSSGTILAVERILVANGWTRGGITRKALRKLAKRLVELEDLSKGGLAGLSDERAGVLPGGVAVLSALFDGLGIEQMETSGFALREGLLYDLVGRIRHRDLRVHTIQQLQRRYHVDEQQARRVARTALALFDQAAPDWSLEDPDDRVLLQWAAELHEVGFDVSRSGYQKHGAYLIANSDLPGFSREDQRTVAALVRAHRRKLALSHFADLSSSRARRALRLCALLRLSFRLNRGRGARAVLAASLTVDGDDLQLTFPEGWLARQPLSHADLVEEARRLEAIGLMLRIG